MKALFLGHFAATVAPRILAKVKTSLETSILDDEGDIKHLAPLLADAEIVVSHIWRASSPPAPRLRLLQSVAAGLDLLDTEAVPKGVTVCNVFGHEPAIAEYVIMTMLVLTHRLFESVAAFRAGSWVASPQFGGGAPHGEVLGRTLGIIGYGRIGREVAERAAGLKCRVLAANRSPVAHPAPAETVFPLADLPLTGRSLRSAAMASRAPFRSSVAANPDGSGGWKTDMQQTSPPTNLLAIPIRESPCKIPNHPPSARGC